MSDYLVRVELHGASYAHYEQLHKAMAAHGFSRQIRGGDGKNYALPTAEYVISTAQDGASVRAAADGAAASTGLKHAVLAAVYSQAWWSGLAST
jgi:hypothetical protein